MSTLYLLCNTDSSLVLLILLLCTALKPMMQDETDFRLDLDRTLVYIVPTRVELCLCVLDILLPGDDALIMRQGDWQVCPSTLQFYFVLRPVDECPLADVILAVVPSVSRVT